MTTAAKPPAPVPVSVAARGNLAARCRRAANERADRWYAFQRRVLTPFVNVYLGRLFPQCASVVDRDGRSHS
jgi:hypothetical protein